MRLVVTVVISLLVLGLSGCVGSEEEQRSEDRPPVEPEQLDWGLGDCDLVIVLLPAEAAAVEAHLPDGFAAVVHTAIGAPPDPRMEAIMGLEALRCAEGTGLNETVQDMAYGSIWTGVEPPAGMQHEHSDLMFYKWDTLVPDAARQERLQDAGAEARAGAATFDLWQPTPAGVSFDVTLEMVDAGSFRFQGSGLSPESFKGDFLEFSGANGTIVWRTWFRADSGYAGGVLASLEPGSLPAQVLGATTVQGYALVGSGVDFFDGWIKLP